MNSCTLLHWKPCLFFSFFLNLYIELLYLKTIVSTEHWILHIEKRFWFYFIPCRWKGKCTINNYPCLDLTGISPNSCRAQENGLFSASTMNFCRMNSIKSVFSYKILVDGHFTTFKSVKLICTIKRSLEKLFSTMYMYYEINQSH